MQLYLDSFDTFDVAHILGSYDSATGSLAIVPGRTNNGVKVSGIEISSNPAWLRRNLPLDLTHIVCGFSFYLPTLPPSSFIPLFSFWNAGSVVGSLCLDSVGRLAYYRDNSVPGGGLTLGGIVGPPSPGGLVQPAVHYYCEIDLGISNASAGFVKVYLAGQQIINQSSVKTSDTSTIINQWSMRSCSLSTGVIFDDLYIHDDTGAINNTINGDTKVLVCYPTGDTTVKDFSPVSGTTLFNMVNDQTTTPLPDDDATYIYSPTIGAQALFTFSDLPSNIQTVFGVQSREYIRKDDASARSFAPIFSHATNGTGIVVGPVQFMGQSYAYRVQNFDTDPTDTTGNTLWTPALVNSMNAGVKVIS